MFLPISAVLFFTETVFWWSWSWRCWSWNSGLDYKTVDLNSVTFHLTEVNTPRPQPGW